MHHAPEAELILIAGALLTAGLAASLLALRVRVPSLVLFLALGMLVGSDGTGWIEFSDYDLARTVGVIALALILFDGGLAVDWDEIKSSFPAAVSLAVVGTVVTAVLTGLAAAAIFDLSTKEGLLLGSILAATDGAAVFAVLRGSSLKRRLAHTLEAESGLNDPVAVVLVLASIEWITDPEYDLLNLLDLVVRQLGIGLVAGVAVGWLAVQAFRRTQLASQGLYPVASLAFAALAYGSAATLDGSGFLAVYLAGLYLGSAVIPAKRTIRVFHDGMGWMAQLSMFIVLGLLVFPSQLDEVIVKGTVLALLLVFVTRPLATVVSLLPLRLGIAEQLTLGYAGLRGAVPVVLATFPVIEHVPRSLELFNIVFFAVLLSTVLQGSTFEAVARRLGATSDEPAVPPPLLEVSAIRGLGAEILEHTVREGDAAVGMRVRHLDLPRDAVVSIIVRGGTAIPPRGAMRLAPGDRLHVLFGKQAALGADELAERWRTGPLGPKPRPARSGGHEMIFKVGPWRQEEGDPMHPKTVTGVPVVDVIRIRRDIPGALAVLLDGRYSVTGPVTAVGSREDVIAWARRRLPTASDAERAWLQTAIAGLAADSPLNPA